MAGNRRNPAMRCLIILLVLVAATPSIAQSDQSQQSIDAGAADSPSSAVETTNSPSIAGDVAVADSPTSAVETTNGPSTAGDVAAADSPTSAVETTNSPATAGDAAAADSPSSAVETTNSPATAGDVAAADSPSSAEETTNSPATAGDVAAADSPSSAVKTTNIPATAGDVAAADSPSSAEETTNSPATAGDVAAADSPTSAVETTNSPSRAGDAGAVTSPSSAAEESASDPAGDSSTPAAAQGLAPELAAGDTTVPAATQSNTVSAVDDVSEPATTNSPGPGLAAADGPAPDAADSSSSTASESPASLSAAADTTASAAHDSTATSALAADDRTTAAEQDTFTLTASSARPTVNNGPCFREPEPQCAEGGSDFGDSAGLPANDPCRTTNIQKGYSLRFGSTLNVCTIDEPKKGQWISFQTSSEICLEVPAFSANDSFCFKSGACGAGSPWYIQLKGSESLPSFANSATFTLCTTTVRDNEALCCDQNDAATVEVKNCGYSDKGKQLNRYVYRFSRIPATKQCGSVCTKRSTDCLDIIPLNYTVEDRKSIPLKYDDLEAKVQANVVQTTIKPASDKKLKEREIWLKFAEALKRQMADPTADRRRRSSANYNVQLLSVQATPSDLVYKYYATDASGAAVEANRVVAAGNQIKDLNGVASVSSTVKLAQVKQKSQMAMDSSSLSSSNNAYIIAILSIVGTVAGVVVIAGTTLWLCKNRKKRNFAVSKSILPKKSHNNNNNPELGGIENPVMADEIQREHAASVAAEKPTNGHAGGSDRLNDEAMIIPMDQLRGGARF